MVIVLGLAESVLVLLPWVKFNYFNFGEVRYYSLSGLETWAVGRGDVLVRPGDAIPIDGVVVSGYLVVALAAVACLSAILLLRRVAPIPIALVVVTGIATTSVAGHLATSDWQLIDFLLDWNLGLDGDPTWALYSEIGLGVVHTLIGGVLGALYIRARRTRPRLTSTPPSAHIP